MTRVVHTGYAPTTDAYGWYGPDANGRKPGLYTLLGGYPNYWPKSVVDQNLRQLNNDAHAYDQGAFDKDSIMKYYFPASMFLRGERSHCYSQNLVISAEDQKGIEKWYRAPGQALSAIQNIQRSVLSNLTQLKSLNPSTRQSLQLRLNKIVPTTGEAANCPMFPYLHIVL